MCGDLLENILDNLHRSCDDDHAGLVYGRGKLTLSFIYSTKLQCLSSCLGTPGEAYNLHTRDFGSFQGQPQGATNESQSDNRYPLHLKEQL